MRKVVANLCLMTSLFVFLGLAGAALAAPDRAAFDLSGALQRLDQALAKNPWVPIDLPHVTGTEVAEAAPQVLTPIAPVTYAPATAVRFQPLDMRLPLAMISQSHGGGDNDTVVMAQGPRGPDALVLREGRARMIDLSSAALNAGAARLGEGGALILTRPLIVWDGAELILTEGETLLLDRSAGAFVMVLGDLSTNGATIAGTGDENAGAPKFRPFVVAGSGGLLTLKNSTFARLGFGHTEKFSGVSIMRNGLMMGRGVSQIHDNLFDQVNTLSIDTAQDVEIIGNRFRATPKVALALTNAGRPVVRGNVFFQNGEFNAIQVLRGSYGAVIEDNLILGGGRAGIVVKFDSHRAEIRRNVVWKRDGAGIIFAKSNCGVIEGNWVLQNRQKGIEVRTSKGTEVRANHVALNRNTGLWVSGQAETVATLVKGNVFSQNRAGLTTATAAHLVMDGNDFSGQVPRFLSGDVATQNAAFAQGLGNAMVLSSAGVTPAHVPPTGCVEGVAR